MKYVRLLLIIVTFFSLTVVSMAETLPQLLEKLQAAEDSLKRKEILDKFFANNSFPLSEGNLVHFLYRGPGRSIAVPGEMNGWNPALAPMTHVSGTDLSYRTEKVPPHGRIEYKIWVDSTWMLDPLNGRRALGGFGYNSDFWMPKYVQSTMDRYRPRIARGRIDSFMFESKVLKRTYPVYVYRPPTRRLRSALPTIYVTDGGEYLTIARMNVILDNLLADRLIRPVLGVFIDPRTRKYEASSNKRMIDYAANEKYLDFLEKELTPYLRKRYGSSTRAADRLILGASMGGLISAYAVLKRPGFIENSAAQSPAFWQADSAVIRLLHSRKRVEGRFYIDTGTIHDTDVEAKLASILLQQRGATVSYSEYPEGHNWTNWRARIPTIVRYFFPRK